jgi:hypothetical protein
VIKPDRVLNDLRRETVTFVHRCRLVHSTIVIQTCLTCQYPTQFDLGDESRYLGVMTLAAT